MQHLKRFSHSVQLDIKNTFEPKLKRIMFVRIENVLALNENILFEHLNEQFNQTSKYNL